MSAIIASSICILPVLIPMLLLIRQAKLQQSFLLYVRTAAVPPLTERAQLSAFKTNDKEARKRIQRCSDWSVGCVFLAFFLICTFWRALPDGSFFVALACMSVSAFLALRNSDRKTNIANAVSGRPEFRRFVMIEQIYGLEKKVRRVKRNADWSEVDPDAFGPDYVPQVTAASEISAAHEISEYCTIGTMDEPALIINLAADASADSPGAASTGSVVRERSHVSYVDQKAVSNAHTRALNDRTLKPNDTVLVLFKGATNELKAYIASVDNVSLAPADSSTELGRVVIGDYTFCGGKIAHFDKLGDTAKLKNDFLTHGWVATLDCAPTLLAVLYWLDDDQRDLITSLVELAKPLPA